jgi:hypothetical protein
MSRLYPASAAAVRSRNDRASENAPGPASGVARSAVSADEQRVPAAFASRAVWA